MLRGAIAAQRATGAPLMIHPGRHPHMPMELAEFVRKEGGDLRRTIMCHICRTIADVSAVIDLAQTGIWLEYDLFGLENSYYPYNPSFDMPNDVRYVTPMEAPIQAISRNLRKRRVGRGVSLSELSRLAGISKSTQDSYQPLVCGQLRCSS